MSLFRELKGERPSVLGDLFATLVQPHAVLQNKRGEDREIAGYEIDRISSGCSMFVIAASLAADGLPIARRIT